MTKSPQKKQWLANALLVLGSLGFAVVVAEVALRLMGIGYPSFYQVDPQRGHSLIPNFSSRWTHEGNGLVRINADGLRDRHYERRNRRIPIALWYWGILFPKQFRLMKMRPIGAP